MAQVTEGVYFIPGQDELIPDSHTYVIGRPPSEDFSLIDPGLVGKGKTKLDSLRRMGVEPGAVKRIILTHTHFDHIGCLPELLEEIPGVELWIHRLEAEPLERGDERTVYGMDAFQEVCEAQYGIESGAFTFQVSRKLDGGERLNMGGMVWEIIHIPGHSMGSIGLYHQAARILIPGDVVYADHAIGRCDLFGSSAAELRKSLSRLAELDVDILLPGHNRIVQSLPAGHLRETALRWEAYLA